MLRRITIGMFLLALVLLELRAQSCPENEFALPENICCTFCSEGWYRTVNCTKQQGFFNSGRCSKCTLCEDGVEIASCTRFSNTQCQKMSTPVPNVITERVPPTTSSLDVIDIVVYVTASMVFFTITITILYLWLTRRSMSRDPAEKPLKIMI